MTQYFVNVPDDQKEEFEAYCTVGGRDIVHATFGIDEERKEYKKDIKELVRALKIAREGVFLDRNREDEINYILSKYVSGLEQIHFCGKCDHFIDEVTDGTGWCDVKNMAKMCWQSCKDNYIPKN